MVTKHQQIKNYYNHPAVSQSLLKKLIERPLDILIPQGLPSEAMRLGLAVDILITQPEEAYRIKAILEQPAEGILKVMESMMQDDTIGATPTPKEVILHCDKTNFWKNYKEGTRYDKFIQHINYWKAIQDKDNIILTQQNFTRAHNIAKTLKDKLNITEQEKQYYTFQTPIFFTYNNTACKALVDIIYRKDDYIQIIDLKTTSFPLIQFPNVVMKFRYDIQAAFYYEAVRQYFQNDNIEVTFIVQHTTDIHEPITAICSKKLLHVGKYGNDHMKGYTQLIDDYNWYQQHGYNNHKDLQQGDLILDVKNDYKFIMK